MSGRAAIRLGIYALGTLGFSVLLVFLSAIGWFAPGFRRRLAVRCTQAWCRLGCACLDVDRRVRGDVPTGVFVAVSNHVSYLDILVLGSLFPTVFVAKREIEAWPLFGWLARSVQTLFVDRESRRDAVRASERIAATLESGLCVTLFAEGKITTGAEVLPFRPSLLRPAADARVPCVPFAVRYETSAAGVRPWDQLCWPPTVPLRRHVVALIGMRGVRATVDVCGSPVVESDRKALARRLHEDVASRFVPMPQPPAERGGCAVEEVIAGVHGRRPGS